jgi:hypothetical protein
MWALLAFPASGVRTGVHPCVTCRHTQPASAGHHSLPPRTPRCRSTKPQVTAAYKEGLYQKTAGPWMEDITATLQALPFNLSQVGARAVRSVRAQMGAHCWARMKLISASCVRYEWCASHAFRLYSMLAGIASRGPGAHQHPGLTAGHHGARRLCQKPQAQVQLPAALSLCLCTVLRADLPWKQEGCAAHCRLHWSAVCCRT